MIDWFNTTAAGALALGSGWVVMSPRVRIGLLMHLGLVLVAIGFLGVFLVRLGPYAATNAISAANAFVHAGLVLCAIGYVCRARRRGHQRRASDWVDRRAPVDSEPDSGYPRHQFDDRIPDGFPPCDTQPTSPGLLDTLPGRLK